MGRKKQQPARGRQCQHGDTQKNNKKEMSASTRTLNISHKGRRDDNDRRLRDVQSYTRVQVFQICQRQWR